LTYVIFKRKILFNHMLTNAKKIKYLTDKISDNILQSSPLPVNHKFSLKDLYVVTCSYRSYAFIETFVILKSQSFVSNYLKLPFVPS